MPAQHAPYWSNAISSVPYPGDWCTWRIAQTMKMPTTSNAVIQPHAERHGRSRAPSATGTQLPPTVKSPQRPATTTTTVTQGNVVTEP